MICPHCFSILPDGSTVCRTCSAPLPDRRATPLPPITESARQLRAASLWRRAAAFLIDASVLATPSWLLPSAGSEAAAQTLRAFGYVALLTYFPLLESSPAAATLGKRVLGICVVREQGDRVGIGRAYLRYLARFVPLDPLLLMFTFGRVSLHDWVANTRVISRSGYRQLRAGDSAPD